MERPQRPGIGLALRLAEVTAQLPCLFCCEQNGESARHAVRGEGSLCAEGRTRGRQGWPFPKAEICAKGEPASPHHLLACHVTGRSPAPHLAGGIPAAGKAPVPTVCFLCVLTPGCGLHLHLPGLQVPRKILGREGQAGVAPHSTLHTTCK